MGKKILIIEDDSTLLTTLIEWFSDEGFDAYGSGTVPGAFDKIEKNKPDVILTDLIMANLDGFDVLKKVKESVDLKDVIVIVMSNSGQDSDMERAVLLGARDFLPKSDLSLKDIVERVKRVIAESERESH